jgi:hypothetical protein
MGHTGPVADGGGQDGGGSGTAEFVLPLRGAPALGTRRGQLLMVLALVYIAGDLASAALYGFFVQTVVGLLVGALVVIGFSRRPRLLLSDGGISYLTRSWAVVASWDLVEGVGEVPHGRLRVEGLVLRGSQLRNSPLYDRYQRRLRAKGIDRGIPLAPFDARWRQGRLGEELRRHLPAEVLAPTPPR